MHDLMTWVTLFPLRSATIGACTPRHFCFGATPFSPLKLRGLAKSKMPSSRGKNGGHSPLESVTHVIRLSQPRVLPRTFRSGKQFRQDVSNEIHETVTDHVCRQIAAPQIESSQDQACCECDENVGRAAGPMAKRKNNQRNRDRPEPAETNHPQPFDRVAAVEQFFHHS